MEILVNIDVPDLDSAVRFYEQALSLKPARRLFGNSIIEMSGAPVPVYLVERAGNSAPFPDASAGRDYRRHWTPLHLDFIVDDLAIAVTKAMAAGARLESGPESFAWGSIATLSDPFGHGFCLIHWAGRGYDEAEGSVTPL
jgi:predicted enzyme related to lactoylglutathione lyase